MVCPSEEASEERREVITCPSSTFFSRTVPEMGALMTVSSYSIFRRSSWPWLRLREARAVSRSRSFLSICFWFVMASLSASCACAMRFFCNGMSISRDSSAATRSLATSSANSAFLISARANSNSAALAGCSTNLSCSTEDLSRASAARNCAREASNAACEISCFSKSR